MKALLILLGIFLAFFAWMFRYEVIVIDNVYFERDRWTNNVLECHVLSYKRHECYETRRRIFAWKDPSTEPIRIPSFSSPKSESSGGLKKALEMYNSENESK